MDNNSADGRDSYDMTAGNVLVSFINRNVTAYPTEVGAPKFAPVPVQQQKDIMLNVARLHAEQEYNRIMQLVAVLQQQAQDIKRRLDITDWVHAAKYDFKLSHNTPYWLVEDSSTNCHRLTQTGPNDWTTGAPTYYNYVGRVKWLGDYTWTEVTD